MIKEKIETSTGARNKKEIIKNVDIDKTFLAKVNYFVEYELISEFKNILNTPKIDFINLIMFRLNNFLLNEYLSKNIDEQKYKYLMTYMKEKWEKKYDNHIQNLSLAWEKFDLIRKNKEKNNDLENLYFKNFVSHCSYISEYAIHNCDKNNNKFGKYIAVYDSINNKNTVKYLICDNCRKAYFIDHFLNYCEKCKMNYYSCEILDNKKSFFQVTLKNPHCDPVVNEKIYCTHCNNKSALYLNPKSNVVKCLNCRFITSPNNIEWNCNICSQPFKSDVIIYNKCEVNFVKKIINYALLTKKKARPAKLPCCKNLDLKVTSFYHKKNCKGIIYFAEFHKKLIIICEKCKAVNNFGKFIWTCPQCNLRFKDIKWQENEPKLRREIFSDKNMIMNDMNEEETIKNNNYLRNILNNQIDINNMTIAKKKKNLYDILRKREDYLPEFNKTEANNVFIPEKNLKDNKELLSTEGSDTKNLNNINLELHSENQLYDLIKVKRNNFDQLNEINNKGQNISNIKKDKEKIDEDLLSAEYKKIKKRYIFEKLNRRQFVSANNIEINILQTESKPDKIEKIEKIEPKNKHSNNNINKIKNEIIISSASNQSSNNKRKIIAKNRSNIDLRAVPLSSKKNIPNTPNVNILTSEVYNSKNRNNNNHKEIISETKSNHVLMNSIDIDFNTTIKERRNVVNKNIQDKNKNNSPKENKNIDIKKYLFKDSDKKELPNTRNKNVNRINNNSNNNNQIEITIRLNKNNKIFNNNNNNNKNNNNKNNNNNNNNIITSYRRVNRDSAKKNNENKAKENAWKGINPDSKNSDKKEILSTGITSSKYSNNNNNNNNNINNNSNNNNNNNTNNNNNNNKDDSPYSSTSMLALKNKQNNKIPEEKPKYDNSTFRNKKKNNLISKYESSKEIESEQNIPSDIVKVTSIDKMEKIPLNPAIFTNPLLATNIQQRVKHILFRGRLPIFNIDNYTIKKTLGEGTNGVIYQVMNNTNKKFYAMKKLIASTIVELDFLQKEFQICYQNPHENVLTIYGVCVRCFDATTYVLYVLMPLAQKDLEMEISERIRRKKNYKEKELIDMIKQLVGALYYLQKERNVAHRDIKPENILIFKNHVLKLADFGEAKVNNANKKKKTIRGTEFYMSPILYEGNMKSKYDIQHNPFKSDVFSLGYCFICASSLDPEVINEIRQVKDQNRIKQILKKYFPKEYSDKYINLLLKMITLDENERVDFIGLDKILKEY